MKISKSALALSGAVLGLGLVYCEQGTNCVPTKAQLILRQKIDQLNGTSVSRSQTQQLADAERLHKEGTIDDQQFEALKKEINEQYAAAASGANPEASAKAQQALEKKISDLNSRSRNLDAAQAQKKAAHPVTSAVSQEVVQQKIAESRTAQKVNAVPAPAGGTLAPESEAKAREILRTKIAEDRNSAQPAPAAVPEAQAKAVAVLHGEGADTKAGVTPETPDATRILRLKIAESRGTITPAEAEQAIASPAPHTAAAASATGATPVAIQTSNKTGLARLNELTELYKADRLTPYEYHHERAKIVPTL